MCPVPDPRQQSALLVTQDAFFNDRREPLVALAGQYKLPATYPQREFAFLLRADERIE